MAMGFATSANLAEDHSVILSTAEAEAPLAALSADSPVLALAVPRTTAEMDVSAAPAMPITQSDRARSRSPRSHQTDATAITPPSNHRSGVPVALPAEKALHVSQQVESPRDSLQTYKEIDLDRWVAKVVGKSAQGSPTICIYDEKAGCAPRFRLYDQGECGTIVFPLEHKDGWSEKPAFMSGADSSKKTESLDLTITLEGGQLEAMRSIEAWCKKTAVEKSVEFFGKRVTAAEAEIMWIVY
jgi:hypothetical protein